MKDPDRKRRKKGFDETSLREGIDAGSVLEKADKLRKVGSRIRVYVLIAAIVLMIGMVAIPSLLPHKDLRIARPLDMGEELYLRTVAGDVFRISCKGNQDLCDEIQEMIRGTYDPDTNLKVSLHEMSALIVCGEGGEPIRTFWFLDGLLMDPAETDGEWTSYKRRSIEVRYANLEEVFMEKGKLLEADQVPDPVVELFAME